MPILAAFMVPHPPLIVPTVGRGGEEQIRKTTAAYEQAAREIAALKPETIISQVRMQPCMRTIFPFPLTNT